MLNVACIQPVIGLIVLAIGSVFITSIISLGKLMLI